VRRETPLGSGFPDEAQQREARSHLAVRIDLHPRPAVAVGATPNRADAVLVRAFRGGTVAVGIFGEPSAWRVDELVAAFLRRRPDVSVRLVGRNSSAIVQRVRRGDLEAGVVLLPIDDDKLDVRPIVRDEVLYVSASPGRTAARHDRAARRYAHWSSTTPSPPTATRSAASSPSARRRSASPFNQR
jgi:DNA-binding transcriptional LysR family regulator